MDPVACRVIYIDERFNTERWISRDGLNSPAVPQRSSSYPDFEELPADLQANVNAFLSVFNQVFVCRSGRSFSVKLSEIHDQVQQDCTPILACFDVGSHSRHDHGQPRKPRFNPAVDSAQPSPGLLRRELTFSSEADESYGLQLLSRIASDLQVEEGAKLIIPVAIVQPQRKDSYDHALATQPELTRAPPNIDTTQSEASDNSDIIDPHLMLQCLDAGALDVVKSPLDKAGIMGLTVHAYRIYKSAKAAQSSFMAVSRRGRKQSWVGIDTEKPYSYLREAMVRKLLKGICSPEEFIEDYQHRDLFVDDHRKKHVAQAVGKWDYSGQDFSDDELVYAGYYILNHALQVNELSKWRMSQSELLRFMQGCRVAYNSFVLYHNFKHAVDVLQSTFYFLLQLGLLPPYSPAGDPTPHANDKSPIAQLLGPFEALTLLISAIGHDVGHPGVNNMFLVKLNAPLAQLYNDTSVLEAFHCAAYSQILRRHWPAAFNDKSIRKLMISTILATDMGCHSDYMQQLGHLQEKIHESKSTDGWTPKDIDAFRVLTCGLLIKCADISNVARPWAVAEKWTYQLQEEFAHQGEMEQTIGMETTLFGGPPEIGNMLKLANGQIGFMTIFAHPLFANVADIIPAMGFAAEQILTNKGVWFTRAEHEKTRKLITKRGGIGDGGISPRSQSPVGAARNSYFPPSPLRDKIQALQSLEKDHSPKNGGLGIVESQHSADSNTSSLQEVKAIVSNPVEYSAQGPTNSENVPSSSMAPQEQHALPSNQSFPNGVQHESESRSTTPKQEHTQRNGADDGNVLHDTRRDNASSMRAGSSALPVQEMKEAQEHLGPPESPRSALAKFNFATSSPDEPERTYDPQQHYPPVHPSARASAPMHNIEHRRVIQAAKENVDETRAAHSESDIQGNTTHDGASKDVELTPTHSTVDTDYTGEEHSEAKSPSPPTEQSPSAIRDRAVSSPGTGVLRQSFSLKSEPSDSQEGSKYDVRTTVLSNGDSTSEEKDRNRKLSTKTLGRKRSKLKMNLAFWKKRNSERSLKEEEQVDQRQSRLFS